MHTLHWPFQYDRAQLQARAKLLTNMRLFFQERDVLEVKTPVLRAHTVTDPFIESFQTSYLSPNTLYLQTSPEYAMKCLLAEGSGDIYQITPAFRREDVSAIHQPEFLMLEWYRVGWTHHQLMKEVCSFLETMLGEWPVEAVSYRDLFLKHVGHDPHTVSMEVLQERFGGHSWWSLAHDQTTALQCIFRDCIEPSLRSQKSIVCVHGFPKEQSALACLSEDEEGCVVADRFEVYVQGMELANGFRELQCAKTQRARFEKDLRLRASQGLSLPKIDDTFLNALEKGLPACSGVALGVDRLFLLQQESVQQG